MLAFKEFTGFAPGPYCAALSTKDCADYLCAEHHANSGHALAIIFLGCGCASPEADLVRALLQHRCNIKSITFVDIDLRFDTIDNIQKLMQEENHIECFATTSFEMLMEKVQIQEQAKQMTLVLGIHAKLGFTDKSFTTYKAFARQCCSLAQKKLMLTHFLNFVCLPRGVISNTTFHRLKTDSNVWVQLSSWDAEANLQAKKRLDSGPDTISIGQCSVFMDDKRREYLQKQHQAIHADVEALASRVPELLSSFGVPADTAFEVYGDIIIAGDTLLAAYTAAIDVAEEALRKSNKAGDEVEKLSKALKRSESLSILRDHIKDFRIDIAYKMQFPSWQALADRLHYERKKPSKPTHALLETTLKTDHLSMKVWNEVREVVDAGIREFHKGNDLDAKDVMQLLNGNLLPDDLVHTKDSLEQMLQYVEF